MQFPNLLRPPLKAPLSADLFSITAASIETLRAPVTTPYPYTKRRGMGARHNHSFNRGFHPLHNVPPLPIPGPESITRCPDCCNKSCPYISSKRLISLPRSAILAAATVRARPSPLRNIITDSAHISPQTHFLLFFLPPPPLSTRSFLTHCGRIQTAGGSFSLASPWFLTR